jgi:uncharacterized membrane protein
VLFRSNEFLKELEELLYDISYEERLEALSYYENYFDDAGIDREQIIISELGSPANVAAIIKADLGISSTEARNRGYFTENGYEDELMKEQKYEIIGSGKKVKGNTTENNQTSYDKGNRSQNKDYSGYQSSTTNNNTDYNKKHQNNSVSRIILIVVLCIFGSPFILSLVAVVISLCIAAGALFLGLWIAFVAISVAFTFTGVGLTVVGVVRLLTIPVIGLGLTGAGLVLFGIGLLFSIATIGLSTKVIPVIIRGIVNVCRLPFKNRRVPA